MSVSRARKKAEAPVTLEGVQLSSPGRVLFPKAGLTKLDLARYYASMAEPILRFVRDRPLTLRPFPRGVSGPSFWMQDAPRHTPDFVRTWRWTPAATGRPIDRVLASDTRTLVWLAQYNVIELHAWLARTDQPEHPDFAVLDLDAHSGASFEMIVHAARLVRDRLGEIELAGFPKVSGSSGLHVLIPIERRYSFEAVRAFVHALGRTVSQRAPRLVTTDLAAAQREKLVHFDYAQNGEGKTLAAPYSVRPRPTAPVSAPIRWDELEDGALRPDRWTIRDMPARLSQVGDLVEPAYSLRQHLPA
jgi:bifunctional non-homologous end joining protein LigD